MFSVGNALVSRVHVAFLLCSKRLERAIILMPYAAKLTATGLHAALTDGCAFRPVAQTAQPGIQLPKSLKAAE
jgi:hypothetical protein